jgi:hypothetical protein
LLDLLAPLRIWLVPAALLGLAGLLPPRPLSGLSRA